MANDFGNAQDLVVIDDIRENTILLKDGSLRQVIMVNGINMALKSEEEQTILISSYQNFLNSIDYPIQIIIHSRKVNIEKYVKHLEGRLREEASALLQNQISEYQKFVLGFVQENAIMEKIFLVVVPFVPVEIPTTSSVTNLIPFLKKSPKPEEMAKERAQHFTEHLAQLSQRVTQVLDGLRAVGLDGLVLNNQELIELFYNLYNPETIEKEGLQLPKE
jgi:type IV secretory pathway VirB4 component